MAPFPASFAWKKHVKIQKLAKLEELATAILFLKVVEAVAMALSEELNVLVLRLYL